MTIDEAIKRHKDNYEMRSANCIMDDIDKYIIECDKQYVEWLEELKELREQKAEMQDEKQADFAFMVEHDKETYNKAIDDLIFKINKHKTNGYVTGITHNPFEFGACQMADDIVKIAEQLKGGV